MQFPQSFDDLSELVMRIWATSPMAVGIVVGLTGVGLLKLFTVRCTPELKETENIDRPAQGGEKSAEQTSSSEAEKTTAGKTE